jgi:hypothetical protein
MGMFRLLSLPLWSSYSKRDITWEILFTTNCNIQERNIFIVISDLLFIPWIVTGTSNLWYLGFVLKQGAANIYISIISGQIYIVLQHLNYFDKIVVTADMNVMFSA